MNRFPESQAGSHYGYPECWSEYKLSDAVGLGAGTQWAWPGFSTTDEECREIVPPALAMQAHSAPLEIKFFNYTSDRPDACTRAFPESMDGHAFIAFHGSSWNMDIPNGYKVVSVPMTETGKVNASEPLNLIDIVSNNMQLNSGYQPVDVAFDECGRLLVTSDGSSNGKGSNLVRIAYGEVACCGEQSTDLN